MVLESLSGDVASSTGIDSLASPAGLCLVSVRHELLSDPSLTVVYSVCHCLHLLIPANLTVPMIDSPMSHFAPGNVHDYSLRDMFYFTSSWCTLQDHVIL